ncbi:nuclear intron maturase 4, mitochondrial-like [Vigna radiata var. radiata]|uniref:Nuclear intron maturase 4, mitochondrial-like n=1 Tax=Vigna radiata var. radiata TaxID=3916 RepID=A0A3Q0F2Q5_VIGRR|nr:nuclear intron maturase 4, mitochondrial-like [Vigna radiata var. radiata]
MRIVTVANSLKSLRSLHFLRVTSSAPLQFKDKQQFEIQPRSATYSPDNDHIVGKSTLAMDLASVLEEPKPKPKPRNRMELKRFFELRIEKRVKEQHTNGKFHDLMT